MRPGEQVELIERHRRRILCRDAKPDSRSVPQDVPRTGNRARPARGEYEEARPLGRETCNAAISVLSDDAAATPGFVPGHK